MTKMREKFLTVAVAKSTAAGQYAQLPPSIRHAVAEANVKATLRAMKLGPQKVAALARHGKAPKTY